MKNDSTAKTIIVTLLLCIVCSVLVSYSAVALKPLQELNKKLDVKKNLLLASGLIESSDVTQAEIDEAFKMIDTKLIDLATGEVVTDIDVDSFNAKKASKKPKMHIMIEPTKDFGRIKMRAKYAKVYLVKENGATKMIVLPVYGKGLWSTLYGFLALSSDTRTIEGFGFYEHGETPGLGGEVDNPRWKNSWKGKMALNESYEVIIKVIKGRVDPRSAMGQSQIDGLSGATLTSNGVTGLVRYWLGEDGFGPFLTKFREGGSY